MKLLAYSANQSQTYSLITRAQLKLTHSAQQENQGNGLQRSKCYLILWPLPILRSRRAQMPIEVMKAMSSACEYHTPWITMIIWKLQY